jgi:hypothetical protein
MAGSSSGASDNPNHSQTLSARSLINKASGTFFAGDVLNQNAGAIFSNAASATLDLQAGVQWSGQDQSDPLVNDGAMTVDSLGDTVLFTGYLVNHGTVNVNAGTLSLHDGGINTGSIVVAANATLLFPGFASAFSFNAPGSLTGAGTVQLGGDSFATFGPGTTYNVSGTTQLSGELTLNNGASTMGTLNITDAGGELSGSASVTVTGLTTWNGGVMTGSGSTDAKGGLQLGTAGASGSTSVKLAGRSLINEGTATWYSLNALDQSDGSIFTNLAGATLNFVGAPDWEGDSSSHCAFINKGTVTFAGGSDTTLVKVYIDNDGSVQISSGTFGFADSGIINGSIAVASSATFSMGNNFNYEAYVLTATSSLTGAGSVDFGSGVNAPFESGSTYNITGSTTIDTGGNNDANVIFAAGSKLQSLGTLNVSSGMVVFSTGATVTVPTLNQTAGTLTGPDNVVVTGMTSWSGGTMSGPGTTTAAGGLTLGATDGSFTRRI